MLNLLSTSTPMSFSPTFPQHILGHGVVPLHVQNFGFLAEFHEIIVSPFLQLANVPLDSSVNFWYFSITPSFVSSGGLLRAVPSTRPSTLNRTGPNIDLQSTPLVTWVQLDFVPQTTMLWALPFWQFSICPSSCSFSPDKLP